MIEYCLLESNRIGHNNKCVNYQKKKTKIEQDLNVWTMSMALIKLNWMMCLQKAVKYAIKKYLKPFASILKSKNRCKIINMCLKID